MVPKGLEKGLEELEIRERMKTIQTKEFLRFREEFWRPKTCRHSDFSEGPPGKT